MMKHSRALILLLLLLTRPAWAQDDSLIVSLQADAQRTSYFQPRQLIAPALLIGLGTWGLADDSPIDWLAQKGRNDMNVSERTTEVDQYLQYVPTAAHLVLGFIPGVKARHNFRDRLLASVTANVLMAGVTNAVKYTVRERRPDSDKRNSFFSGHTATAFTGAELLRIEYGWGYGTAAYALATATAYLRVYNKRHWVGDVLAGAGAGILCADAGYWLLPVWKRWLGIDKRDAVRRIRKESKPLVVAAPFYQCDDKAAGLSCSIVL